MLRRIVSNHWFAFADLFLVILGGLLWISKPEIGILPIISIALIPWLVRLMVGMVPFKNTPLDWLVAIFLITAWGGYWAAYDREAAWSKVWLIVLGILLFYALAAQPRENLEWVCIFFFCIGIGVSIYFFLTQDFVALPRKVDVANRIGRWMMGIRPELDWTPIHPNYVAGIAALTTPFILYPVSKMKRRMNFFSIFFGVFIVTGLCLSAFAILMATSRGIFMAIVSAIGIWFVWRIADSNKSRFRFRREELFPALVFAYLCAVVLFLYAGPANSVSANSDYYYYGTGSRRELVTRSLYLISALPFTGGGLNAFPGLYSYYMLRIPNFNVANSHNIFLDVAIEQGLLGGLSVLIIFLTSILLTSKVIAKANSSQVSMFSWLTLFALVMAFVHGLVSDYLYNGNGTLLLLSVVGISITVQPEKAYSAHRKNYHNIGYAALIGIGIFLMQLDSIRSAWYADLGAIQMEKVELAGFPTNQWTEPSILSQLKQAEALFHSALQANSANRTANYRLGLIALLRQDFDLATVYLERAKQEAPNHRGIIKSLGYCYAWLGDTENAELFLSKIPEAQEEMGIYRWWWKEQGRPELAEKASSIYSVLKK